VILNLIKQLFGQPQIGGIKEFKMANSYEFATIEIFKLLSGFCEIVSIQNATISVVMNFVGRAKRTLYFIQTSIHN
jgi:hypothetical protein